MNVVSVDVSSIKPYWRNPRDNDNAVDSVKQSIERYGFNVPIVLDKGMIIITGHTRYRAILELGWTEVPCVIVDLDSSKAKEYRIADNKTSELAEWNMDALIPELREIADIDYMQNFFSDINIDSLLRETATVDTPTAAEITQVQESLDNRFQKASESEQTRLIEVVCPHCGEGFDVDPEELSNILEKQQSD